MRKGKQVKPGDKIKISEKDWGLVRVLLDKELALKSVIASMGESLREANENLWETLNVQQPQLKDYVCNLNYETKTITVLYKKHSSSQGE